MCCRRAVARPFARAPLLVKWEPSLTVGILPRFPHIKRPPFGGHYNQGTVVNCFYCLLPSAYCLLLTDLLVAHTGLEPVISALRGQRVNQLHQCAVSSNYRCRLFEHARCFIVLFINPGVLIDYSFGERRAFSGDHLQTATMRSAVPGGRLEKYASDVRAHKDSQHNAVSGSTSGEHRQPDHRADRNRCGRRVSQPRLTCDLEYTRANVHRALAPAPHTLCLP